MITSNPKNTNIGQAYSAHKKTVGRTNIRTDKVFSDR